MTDKITSQELKELIHYDELTGVFTWKVRSRGVRADSIAGTDHEGYRRIMIKGRGYAAHRLAWLYMTGEFPREQIDHINCIKDDNRFINLRDVSHAENQRNVPLWKNNTSGAMGVTWRKDIKKWRVRINAGSKRVDLGNFDIKEDAMRARKTAEKKYNYHPNHGKAHA